MALRGLQGQIFGFSPALLVKASLEFVLVVYVSFGAHSPKGPNPQSLAGARIKQGETTGVQDSGPVEMGKGKVRLDVSGGSLAHLRRLACLLQPCKVVATRRQGGKGDARPPWAAGITN